MQTSVNKLSGLWWQAGAADEAPEGADDDQDQDDAQEADVEAEGAKDADLESESAGAGAGGDLDDAETPVELVEQVRRCTGLLRGCC